jgi:hypothetical protein
MTCCGFFVEICAGKFNSLKMFVRNSFIIFFTILSFQVNCQSLESLSVLIKDIQKGSNDSIRIESNKKFTIDFEKILLERESYNRNFDSLKNVSVLSTEDNKFKIYTWVLPYYNGDKYDYFGFIQTKSDTSINLVKLFDSTSVILKPESEKLSSDKWLGAVYYDIITVKKSGKTYYTLLGWKGKNEKETQKILDILSFTKNQIEFGLPVIKTGSVYKKRLLFTYNAEVAMVMRYDKKYNGIVLDHLSENKNFPGSLPGPDGTYDILKLKKGKWILTRDVKIEISN